MDNWSRHRTLRVRQWTQSDGTIIWIRKLPNKSSSGTITEAEARRLIAEEGAILCDPISSLGEKSYSANLF